MKVILLKDISGVGRKYDVKDLKSGYALNFLIPKGDATAATPAAVKRVQAEKAKLDGERKVQEDLLAKNIQDLDGFTLTITGKANEKGHLFAGLHRDAIALELEKQSKLQINPSFIALDHPVKEVGEHNIVVNAGGKSATFKLVIQAA